MKIYCVVARTYDDAWVEEAYTTKEAAEERAKDLRNGPYREEYSYEAQAVNLIGEVE
ncbi:MAG TPA: hypothetical protein VD994_02420 [Prosthecobacter sp.]|nr:hypothetical protein [Prosthecobacter sp.]